MVSRASSIQHPASSIQHPASSIQHVVHSSSCGWMQCNAACVSSSHTIETIRKRQIKLPCTLYSVRSTTSQHIFKLVMTTPDIGRIMAPNLPRPIFLQGRGSPCESLSFCSFLFPCPLLTYLRLRCTDDCGPCPRARQHGRLIWMCNTQLRHGPS